MTNTTNAEERNTILVIGSTGKTGKRVADQLENRGIPVRQGSRSSDIPFDWEEPQPWAPALAGASPAVPITRRTSLRHAIRIRVSSARRSSGMTGSVARHRRPLITM